jgi:hypothetical protein
MRRLRDRRVKVSAARRAAGCRAAFRCAGALFVPDAQLFSSGSAPTVPSGECDPVRSSAEPSIDRPGEIRRDVARHRKSFPPPGPACPSLLITSKRVLGGVFRFESNSRDLLDLVEAAYGGLPPQTFPDSTAEFRVDMRLLPRRMGTGAAEPPAPRIRHEGDRIRADIDASNYVRIDPARHRAQVVVSEDMLMHAYHLRCELIEFAVFILATRGIGLVPLHAACVGRRGRGVLLLGASGSGKTTLALHGLLRGLDLLAEDAVFVHPASLVATGVPNYLHLRSDAPDFVEDEAIRDWVTRAPVIRRRSGITKFEVDLRRRYGRPARGPLALAGAVFVSAQPAGRPDALLMPLHPDQVGRLLEADQPNASGQPGWRRFKRGIMDKGVHQLRRGCHPGDSIDALRRLLD